MRQKMSVIYVTPDDAILGVAVLAVITAFS